MTADEDVTAADLLRELRQIATKLDQVEERRAELRARRLALWRAGKAAGIKAPRMAEASSTKRSTLKPTELRQYLWRAEHPA